MHPAAVAGRKGRRRRRRKRGGLGGGEGGGREEEEKGRKLFVSLHLTERKITGTRVPARAEQIVSSVGPKLQNTVFETLHFYRLPWINTNFL